MHCKALFLQQHQAGKVIQAIALVEHTGEVSHNDAEKAFIAKLA